VLCYLSLSLPPLPPFFFFPPPFPFLPHKAEESTNEVDGEKTVFLRYSVPFFCSKVFSSLSPPFFFSLSSSLIAISGEHTVEQRPRFFHFFLSPSLQTVRAEGHDFFFFSPPTSRNRFIFQSFNWIGDLKFFENVACSLPFFSARVPLPARAGFSSFFFFFPGKKKPCRANSPSFFFPQCASRWVSPLFFSSPLSSKGKILIRTTGRSLSSLTASGSFPPPPLFFFSHRKQNRKVNYSTSGCRLYSFGIGTPKLRQDLAFFLLPPFFPLFFFPFSRTWNSE